jgi:16S rRNA processing protein RimM
LKDRIIIATIGKTSGFKGFLKLNWASDFTEQLQKKKIWETSFGDLEIEQFLKTKDLIRFKGFESLESAKELTNHKIFSTEEESRELCDLGDEEFFWFDMIGLEVKENGETLGVISEIERIVSTDYLFVNTSESLIEKGLPKNFLIPYIDRYIEEVKLEDRSIFVNGAKDILEAS